MKRIISIEMDFDYSDTLFSEIMRIITEKADSNCEMKIRQEIVPDEKVELNIPSFLNKERFRQGKEVVSNG